MKSFKRFPKNHKCPICNTNKDKKCVLIGIVGTKEGHNMQAQPFHMECINLLYDKKHQVIFQRI